MSGWLQFLLVIALLGLTCPPLGRYMAKVYENGRAPGDRFFGPVERIIYRVSGVNPESEQRWSVYALSLLAFSAVSVLILYVQLRVQGHLLLNPDNRTGVPAGLSFNTAVSFLTNTNWQNYSGESTMSQFTQMSGLAFHNFVSAAAGAAVAVALIRGLVRSQARTLGNFWVDLVRTCTRILLPISFVFALFLVSQGVVQNFHAAKTVNTVTHQTQTIPGGAIGSQEAIKIAGQNGGGPYNANAAHPFENPNGLTNISHLWMILLIPFAFPFTFGAMAKDRKQGYVVFAMMFALWFAMSAATMSFETGGSTKLAALGTNQATSAVNAGGGNMEGKETRFGSATCGLYAAATTGTSTGSVNCAHDSLTPLGGGAALLSIMFGEVSPGGTGSGLYGILVFALLSVFIAGLMVGRTPEYLGKKIQAAEMKLVVMYILFVPLAILAFGAASIVMKTPQASLLNHGPHGLTEMIYAFTSASNNNGSAFGGLTGNTQWFNTTLGLCMLIGRFLLMVPVLAIAGSLGRKQRVPASAGTFPTGTPLFSALLFGVVVIVVGLTFFPVVALGPVVEHLVGKS